MQQTTHLKIVVIGGGTGTFELLTGLKKYTPNLTALVSMADDGGSTGILRDEYGVLPPGDIRKALVALARVPQMRDVFNYRFDDGAFAGHSFGNIFLSTVEKMSDNFGHSVKLASKLLNITGQVIPATLDKVTLVLQEENGNIIRGESKLDGDITFKTKRPKVWLEPKASITPEGREAILAADLIVIAPGSLYGSLAAVLTVDGMAEALRETAAPKVLVCNLVREKGQTDDFQVHDFVAEIERFLDDKTILDYVLYNTHRPKKDLLERYYTEEHRTWVTYDQTVLAGQSYTAIGCDLIHEADSQPDTLIRHDSNKTAKILLDIYHDSRARVKTMICNKAIIMMAGYGTRRLPITKALEKCMLPVGNRPVVDYIVEDCIRAGITEFILVVGEEFDQVKRYYGQNQILEDYLEGKGKVSELEEVRHLGKKARFHYVIQDQYQPYGTATPTWLSRYLIKPGEKFLVLNGDAFFYREDGGSDFADFIAEAEKSNAQSALLAWELPQEQISKYGVLDTEDRDGQELYKKIVEKPKPGEAPTNLANPGFYMFDSKIFEFVEKNIEGKKNQNPEGEHYIVDVINDYVTAGNKVTVIRAKGEYLDCGNTEGWLHSNNRIIGDKTA